MSSMWIGSLYKNGPTQHICMSGVHFSTYSQPNYSEKFWKANLLELTNILQLEDNFLWPKLTICLPYLMGYFYAVVIIFVSQDEES